MSNTNTGGPAFPHTVEYKGADCGGIVPHGGMTLRDYFAAKAMPIIAAELYSWKQALSEPIPELTAKMAYEYADAMLKAREQ